MTSAALVRVPRAWGEGGEAMHAAAGMDLGLDEAAIIAAADLGEQTRQLAAALPQRPVVLGGCCCAHVGAAAGLAARHGRIAVVWLDAHGDLNTPESSPSGNAWGMPYRMILDEGLAAVADCVLIGARNLDPPEQEYIAGHGLATSVAALDEVLDGVVGAYIAFDCDVLDPSEIDCFMPEPDGLTLDQGIAVIGEVAARTPILGMGLTALVAGAENPPRLGRLLAAAGLAAA